MDDRKLIKFIAKNREGIKRLMLSNSRMEIVKFVGILKEINSNDLAHKNDLTMQCASTKLLKLYKMGWLDRKEKKSSSGGMEYVYSVPEFLGILLKEVNRSQSDII